MTRPIGYYVHHHGDGHRQRALALAHAIDAPVTLLGTQLAGRTDAIPCIDLPDDRIGDNGFDGRDGVVRPHALHYAPLDHEGIRQRVARVTQWIADARPLLMVIDVSVEMAMLARLASVPTIYVRLSGNRLDAAHREAFRGARGLLAPFAEALDDPDMPADIRAKTFYGPGIVPVPAPPAVESDLIVVVVGKGGDAGDGAYWSAAARALPDRRWRVIGQCSRPARMPPNLALAGWVDNPAASIGSAGLVIGAAGDGVIGSVIGAGRPFICLPEPRPYDEQVRKAARLRELGAAVVRQSRPAADEWPDLVAEALAQDPTARAALADPAGSIKVARWIEEQALGQRGVRQ